MTIPKSYEALAADLASEKILSKTLQGQKEAYMILADERKVDLNAALDREAELAGHLDAALRQVKANWDYAQDKQQRLTVAEQRADDMVYALARIQGRAEMFIDDGMHMPTPSIEAIRDIAAKVELKTAAQHHGDPVAWQYRVSAGLATGWSLWHDGKGEEFKNSYQVETRPLYAEHPAPVADNTQCEECKGWGYHENHYEGGGTECGECGGSGNATVAVVMTGEQILEAMRQSLTDADGGYVFDTAKDDVIAAGRALLEVARLNGLKP